MQIAKAFGAEVTGVCSTRNIDILRTIGADYIIDYKIEGIDKYREYFDLIIGVNGHQPLSVYKRALKRHGIFVHVGGAESQLYQTALQGGWISFIEKENECLLQRANQKI